MLRELFTQDLYVLLLLLCLVLVVSSRQLFSTRFEDFLAIIWNNRYLKIYTREQKKIDVFNILLFINFVIALGVFANLTFLNIATPENETSFLLLKLFAIIVTIFGLKALIELAIGYFFEFSGFQKLYLFNKATYKNISGLVLLFFNILLLFSSLDKIIVIYSAIIILLLINISGFIRFIKDCQKEVILNFFYFLLYLCALEIGPYVILYKVFKDYFG